MSIRINAFRCSFCNEVFEDQCFCDWHENRCDRNPVVFLSRCNGDRACETCKHLWFDRDKDKPFDIKLKYHCRVYRMRGELRKNCTTWEMSDETKKSMKRICKQK